jgi:hypothetical protein
MSSGAGRGMRVVLQTQADDPELAQDTDKEPLCMLLWSEAQSCACVQLSGMIDV